MSKKDFLKSKAKPMLPTLVVQNDKAPAVKSNELDRLTYEIQSNIAELKEIKEFVDSKKQRVEDLKKDIVEKLIYIRDNKKVLLPERTLEDYVLNDLGITKGYFYESIRAYELTKELNAPDRFENVDYKLLASISRFKDDKIKKALLDKAPELSRDDLQYFKHNEDDITVDSVRKYARRTFTYEETDDKNKQQIQDLISLYEKYIKQMKYKKKRKDYYDAQIRAYHVVIDDLNDLLKKW